MTTCADIHIERTFKAPVSLVWQAWTDPAVLVKWWGPKSFTSPECRVDLRPGGKYHFCMRMPDGQDLWSTGTYHEIRPEALIRCSDSFSDPEGNIVSGASLGMGDAWPEVLEMTLTFEAQGDETRFVLHHEGIPQGNDYDMCVQGWNESLDKLAAAVERVE